MCTARFIPVSIGRFTPWQRLDVFNKPGNTINHSLYTLKLCYFIFSSTRDISSPWLYDRIEPPEWTLVRHLMKVRERKKEIQPHLNHLPSSIRIAFLCFLALFVFFFFFFSHWCVFHFVNEHERGRRGKKESKKRKKRKIPRWKMWKRQDCKEDTLIISEQLVPSSN